MTFVPNSINCCCDWGTLLSNAIENQGLDQLQSWKILGLSGRAAINLCSGWLYPGHFPLLPFFMGKSTLIHSEPCTVQHSAGNGFIPDDAAVTNKMNSEKKKKKKISRWKARYKIWHHEDSMFSVLRSSNKTHYGFCNNRSSGFIEIHLFGEYPF